MRPDPKPEPRIIDPEAGIAKLLREGRCRLCPSRWALGRHHLVPRGQRGDDVDDNLVPLCDVCHDGVEKLPMARSVLRQRLTDAEWAYVVGKVGPERARARYP